MGGGGEAERVDEAGVGDGDGDVDVDVDADAAAPAALQPPARAEREAVERSISPGDLSFEASEGRVRALIAGVHAGFGGAASAEVQERLAQAIELLDALRAPSDRALLLDEAELAIRQLGLTPPNLVLFDRLLVHLRRRVGGPRRARLHRAILTASPHLVVALGGLVAILVAWVVTYGFMPLLDRPDVGTLQLVTEAGFIGALTSLMLRFNRLRGSGSLSARDAFFEGLCRPFIGFFFAWMTYYLIDGGLLPFRPASGVTSVHLYCGVAFVTGFSERLAASFVEAIAVKTGGGERGR